MFRRISKTVATALTVVALNACSGGGGTPGSTSPGGGGHTASQKVAVSFRVFVPKAKSGTAAHAVAARAVARLRPLYVPSSVNSITIQETESAGAALTGPLVLLTVGGAGCVSASGGQVCTETVQAALGSDAWAFASYTSGDGTGTAVSVNDVTFNVVQGAANVLALTLNPVLAALQFEPLGYAEDATASAQLPLSLDAYDTAGNVIIGPGAYVNAANVPTPITLTTSTPAFTLGVAAGGGPANLVLSSTADNDLAALNYDGSLVAGTQTVTASATGVTPSVFSVTLTTPTGGLVVPESIAMGEDSATTSAPLAISEPGYGGTFTLTSASCDGIVTFPGTSGAGPSTSVTVSQVGGGTCTILVTDGTNSGSTTVFSTTFGIVLQSKSRKH